MSADASPAPSLRKKQQFTPSCPESSMNLRQPKSASAHGVMSTSFSPGPMNSSREPRRIFPAASRNRLSALLVIGENVSRGIVAVFYFDPDGIDKRDLTHLPRAHRYKLKKPIQRLSPLLTRCARLHPYNPR